MRRILPVTLLLAIALIALLAVIEVQRIERPGSPVGVPTVTPAFSPNGDGVQDTATLTLAPKKRSTVSVWIVNATGTRVRRLANKRVMHGAVTLTWNGKTDAGRIAPEGTYRMQIVTSRLGRTITVPSPIVLDVTAPEVAGVSWDASRFTPRLHAMRAFVDLPHPKDIANLEIEYSTDNATWTLAPTIEIKRTSNANGSATWLIASKMPLDAVTHPTPPDLRLMATDAAGNSNVHAQSASSWGHAPFTIVKTNERKGVW